MSHWTIFCIVCTIDSDVVAIGTSPMTASQVPTPDVTPSQDDPGDDTARRYRFQWTWAAIVCCMLLDDTQDVAEVFCEQHEDVLLKHQDGRFTGQQVKTREVDQPVWKATDDQVRSACVRFAQQEAEFPGLFRGFRFLTCHPFHTAANAQGFRHVLGTLATAATIADLPSNVQKWLARVTREAGVTDIVAFQALKKTSATDDLPKLQDVSMRLIDTLTTSWDGAATCTHDALRRAANALIDECSRASSLDHQQTLPAYINATQQPSTAMTATINGKRMTLERVRSVLNDGLNATALLAGADETLPVPGQGSTELMLKKLTAGGFSAVSCNCAEDLRDKADYLGIAWTKQHGKTKGLRYYDHVRSLALSDAARAFESTQVENGTFGPRMREEFRHRVQQRRTQGQQLYDCTDEHLEGIAYSLTAQCKVQWSINRPWEDSDGHR